MAVNPHSRIAIAGAGSVGCYVGGCLAGASRDVSLLLRPALAQAIGRRGLRISALDGADRTLAPNALRLSTNPATALSGAAIVLVTVKSGATREMAELIARHARPDAVVVSLQNGIGNLDILRAGLGAARRLVAGMVPFNVVQVLGETGPPRVHRATSGTILIARGEQGLRETLDVPGARVAEHSNMTGVQWGKLVLNLNNALNALSGLSLAKQLADRSWRQLLAAQIAEALAVLRATDIRPASIQGVPPRAIPIILRLPDPLFKRVARRMLAIDPRARSSMWEDLDKRRPTEVDHFQGVILDLAAKAGVATPITERIARLVKGAESAGNGSPELQPSQVASVG